MLDVTQLAFHVVPSETDVTVLHAVGMSCRRRVALQEVSSA